MGKSAADCSTMKGLFRGARKLRFGPVHRGAHVRQRLIEVVIGFEL